MLEGQWQNNKVSLGAMQCYLQSATMHIVPADYHNISVRFPSQMLSQRMSEY